MVMLPIFDAPCISSYQSVIPQVSILLMKARQRGNLFTSPRIILSQSAYDQTILLSNPTTAILVASGSGLGLEKSSTHHWVLLVNNSSMRFSQSHVSKNEPFRRAMFQCEYISLVSQHHFNTNLVFFLDPIVSVVETVIEMRFSTMCSHPCVQITMFLGNEGVHKPHHISILFPDGSGTTHASILICIPQFSIIFSHKLRL